MNKLLLPRVVILESMKCEDHITYVVPYNQKGATIKYWNERGLHAMDPIVTKEYPAEHIAFVEKPGATRTCEKMVGLSVSTDRMSPINKMCDIFEAKGPPGRIQHIAYSVEPKTNIKKVRSQLEAKGVIFMTPILEYTDENGASLRQMFVASRIPYGPFIEIIQRTLSPTGIPFQGFNSNQIDALYRAYDSHSRKLEKKS